MGNAFNHSLCGNCWNILNPRRQAAKLINAEPEKCCRCGKNHRSGIYVRATPSTFACAGVHGDLLKTPLDELPFPVVCASCKAGPFNTAIAVDEHITEEHLAEAVWAFAHDHMKHTDPQGGEVKGFTCPVCHMTSYHPEDIRQGYCGNCHAFTGSLDLRSGQSSSKPVT